MTRTSKRCERLCQMMIPLAFLLALLISLTGCPKRYVVIDGQETITVQKNQIDKLYQNNEDLLKALTECKGKK